jgi:hypothetical protein
VCTSGSDSLVEAEEWRVDAAFAFALEGYRFECDRSLSCSASFVLDLFWRIVERSQTFFCMCVEAIEAAKRMSDL